MRKDITIQKIAAPYVGKNCVHIMVPFKKEIVMLNKNGIILLHNKENGLCVNKYNADERRKEFLSLNEENNYKKLRSFNNYKYYNHLLDFEKPYIRFVDSSIIESYVLKDNNEALLINKSLNNNVETFIMTRKQIEDLFLNSDGKHIIHLDPYSSKLKLGKNFSLEKESEIKNFLKEDVQYCVKEFRKYVKRVSASSIITDFLKRHPWFLDYAEQSVDVCDLDSIKTCIPVGGGHAIIVDFNKLIVQIIDVYYIGSNNYLVDLSETPISMFSLRNLGFIPKDIIETKQSKIYTDANSDCIKYYRK